MLNALHKAWTAAHLLQPEDKSNPAPSDSAAEQQPTAAAPVMGVLSVKRKKARDSDESESDDSSEEASASAGGAGGASGGGAYDRRTGRYDLTDDFIDDSELAPDEGDSNIHFRAHLGTNLPTIDGSTPKLKTTQTDKQKKKRLKPTTDQTV